MQKLISGIVNSVVSAALALGIATSVSAQEDPLRIGVTIWPGWMPWWIVEEKGFLQEAGANAELVHFKRHADGMGAFAAKQLDAHHMILADVIVPAAAGVPGRIVLITDESSGADGILAKVGIDSIADFRGRRVAYEFGGVSQLILTEALNRAGLTFDDITSINMSAEDAGTAFLAGAVDVAVTWEPYLSQGVADGKGNIAFSTADTPGLVPDLLVFRQESIEERSKDIEAVLSAWSMALSFLETNREEAIEIMARGAGIRPDEMETNLSGIRLYSLNDNISEFGTAPDGKFFQTAADQAEFLKKHGFIENLPDIPSLIAPQFVAKVVAE